MEGQMTVFDIKPRPTAYEIYAQYGIPLFKLPKHLVPLDKEQEIEVRKKAAKLAEYERCMKLGILWNDGDKEEDYE